MDVLFPILFVLVIILIIITVVGHLIWLTLAWIFRAISGGSRETPPETVPTILSSTPASTPHTCPNCQCTLSIQLKYCGVCGAQRPTLAQEEHLRELEITLRQLERLHQSGAVAEEGFRALRDKIAGERELILFPNGRPGAGKQPSQYTPPAAAPKIPLGPSAEPTPPRSVSEPVVGSPSPAVQSRPAGEWTKDSDEVPPSAHIHPPPPRKPFAEVLASFMEQSNIRWGEIIGGLLIIGCSTALVVSLWAQISRVPTVKFLIFTTVTAALFGVGFYTEHHWKLPTTSRGILTIATL